MNILENHKNTNTAMTYSNNILHHIFLKNIRWHFIAWSVYLLLDFISVMIFENTSIHWPYVILNIIYILFIFYSIPLILWVSLYRDKSKIWTSLTIIASLSLISCLKLFLTISLTEIQYNWNQLLIAEFWRVIYFGLLSFGFWFIIFSVLMKNQNLQAKNETLKAKLDLAKGQLSPHFLFNSLNSFRSALFTKSRDLSDWLVELSELIKYGVISSEGNLSEELNMTVTYINLEKRRQQEELPIIISSNIDHNIAKKLFIPRMALLSLVENIYKHGDFNDVNTPARLTFSLRNNNQLPGRLTFSMLIENKINPSPHSSLGSGINRIIEILEFYFPDKFKLIHNKTKSDFDLYLSLDYEYTAH
ncbi:histidine kinase [Echinicola sp. CAU 1574]|uniref:Histidine kinase n=1 Tax=Echinicola arenosa TaxID=2774144 RepID=A0ABR9ANH8_9BACT|nr:sensor histidine kinase [Echinicola arenosa]MBD8489169.1 histidine kinase [Echinicola arenosa]